MNNFRVSDDSPCHFCKPPKRREGCHGVCGEYQTWRAALTRQREGDRASEREYHEYIESSPRTKRARQNMMKIHRRKQKRR